MWSFPFLPEHRIEPAAGRFFPPIGSNDLLGFPAGTWKDLNDLENVFGVDSVGFQIHWAD